MMKNKDARSLSADAQEALRLRAVHAVNGGMKQTDAVRRFGVSRAALAKCEELSPGFVKSRRNWQPYADPASNERLQAGLRRIEG